MAIGALPVGIVGAAVGGYLFLMRRPEKLEPRHADGIFSLAGTAGFALAIALGLVIAKGAPDRRPGRHAPVCRALVDAGCHSLFVGGLDGEAGARATKRRWGPMAPQAPRLVWLPSR